jgi:2-dehydro-3-deoxyphosphogluconate aldolase/(4S)-4-hydroxy-2-oxoglutarate aldolase
MDITFLSHRIVPVLAWDDPATCDLIARGLVDGGLPVVEATFRSQRAREVLRALAQHDDLLVGAGTVTSAEQVSQARDSGARFIVSPGLSAAVVRACQDAGLPIVPGIATPTEIMAARDFGLHLLKFFPAEQLGGVPMLKALTPVFPDVRFVPTGGIGAGNVNEYLALDSVAAVGGTWMFDKQALASGDLATFTRSVAAARARVMGD